MIQMYDEENTLINEKHITRITHDRYGPTIYFIGSSDGVQLQYSHKEGEASKDITARRDRDFKYLRDALWGEEDD